MSTATKKRKRKDSVTHLLTKKLVISVFKMKVTELSKWTPVLQSEQTPTLCFEGYVSRINGQKRRHTVYKTQPLNVRLGSYLFRQANGETCSLVGELYDPSNNLPLSVKSKFKNGIPKKWQTIAELWDNMQKQSFCRKQLRSFSSRIAWVESLKSSGVLRVSSRGRIIIPSPKYLKGKNVERRDVETAHLINSHLKMIRTNLDLTPVHKTDDIGCTPRQPMENTCNTVNVNKSHHCTDCENPTEKPLNKNNFSHKISEHSHTQTQQNSGNRMNGPRRSSINQKKLLTCKRKLMVDEVQNKICRSSKTAKNTYEKITNKHHYRCLPHRRKYLLRSTSAPRLLQKNNQCRKEQRVTSVNMRNNERIVILQRNATFQTKRKLNVLNNKNSLQCQGEKNVFSHSKQNREGKSIKDAGSCNENAVKNSVLEPEPCSEEHRNESAVDEEKNKKCKALLKFPNKEPCLTVRDIQSDSVLRNCANRFRKSKQRICCQDSSDTGKTKRKSENSPPPKTNRKGVKTLKSTFADSGPVHTNIKSTGYVEPLPSKRHKERSSETILAESQDLLKKNLAPRKISEDISKREKFSENPVISAFNNSKCSQSRLVSNEREAENRRSAVRIRQNEKRLHKVPDNEKQLHKVPDKSRKKSLSTNKTSAVTSDMKIEAETLEDTKEEATAQGKTLTCVSRRKICKNDSKQPRISDPQSSEKTDPFIPCTETSETPPRKSEKTAPHLSLDDIEDILTTGAPRTLKQRKKLRKTIDSYAKSQTACSDLFSDPDYNHLIGDNDPCSSQEWDRDYAEAIEKLVNGKLSDQISLGSTSPAQYLQDFVCDDNQSVRSTSPFERTPCDEEFKLRYEHRVLKERNEHTRRKSLNMDLLSSFAHRETDASNEADAAYTALIQGKPVPQKLFDLKCKKNNSSDDSSSECSDEL